MGLLFFRRRPAHEQLVDEAYAGRVLDTTWRNDGGVNIAVAEDTTSADLDLTFRFLRETPQEVEDAWIGLSKLLTNERGSGYGWNMLSGNSCDFTPDSYDMPGISPTVHLEFDNNTTMDGIVETFEHFYRTPARARTKAAILGKLLFDKHADVFRGNVLVDRHPTNKILGSLAAQGAIEAELQEMIRRGQGAEGSVE